MNLIVHLPYRVDEDSSRALSLAQRAPSFTVEWTGHRRMAVAIFSSLPKGLEEAVQLVGESVRLPGAWASLNAKPLSSLTGLWQRLSCFQDSLCAPDAARYCHERSVLFHQLVDCTAHRCPVSCQFMCRPCLTQGRTDQTASHHERWRRAAVSAEIDWCPRLQFPGDDIGSPIDPASLRSHPLPSSA